MNFDPAIRELSATLHTARGSFALRAATAADQGTINDLIHSVSYLSKSDLGWEKFFVARNGAGEAAGIIGFKPQVFGNEVRGIVVAPEHRGIGLGTAMLDAATEHYARFGPVFSRARPNEIPFHQRAGYGRLSISQTPPGLMMRSTAIAGALGLPASVLQFGGSAAMTDAQLAAASRFRMATRAGTAALVAGTAGAAATVTRN